MKNYTSGKKQQDRQNDFFDQFSGKEKARMEEIWQLSRQAKGATVDIESREMEQDLAAVQQRIAELPPQKITSTWKWYAVAAAVLLIFGAGMLFAPQTVTTPRGEIVKTTLPDGSTIELNSGSEIQYNRLFGYTNRNIELEGEAYFSVKKGDQPFFVEANGAKVKVVGTKFNVRSWHDEPSRETAIAVAEGVVQFASLDNPEQFVTLHKGEFSRWMATLDQPTLPQTVSVEKRIGWREHKLLFNKKSLRAIFNELERRFDLTIRLDTEHLAQETLTAFYNNPTSAAVVLKDICRVKGLRYSQTNNGYRVYP